MVMEIPSPVCVGREFVRQYYTVLNKSPLHLHRFYSNDSSFVHGGLEKHGQESHVVGQQDIHKMIMQLNFRDCHAKIRQVDSHDTLGNGVVVQVTGELSNDGQPMRRFMQTFVLAPQTPRKYYVRNDIFRYQDEVFTDSEDTQENDGETEEPINQESDDGIPNSNMAPYYEQEIVRNGTSHISEAAVVPAAVVAQPPPIAPEIVSPPPPPPSQPVAAVTAPTLQPQESEPEEPKSSWEDEAELQLSNTQEPKTYANMVSKNASAGFSALGGAGTPAPFGNQSKFGDTSPSYTSKPDTAPFGSSSPAVSQSVSGTSPNQPAQPPRQQRQTRTPTLRNTRLDRESSTGPSPRSEDGDGDQRKPLGQYPDSHQLFVGNLPHSIGEEQLKQHFMHFGNVLEFRINTKQNLKAAGGKSVPNFGFVVFESLESVKKVLEARPVFFGSTRLNIEEKKVKPRDQKMGDNRLGSGRGGMNRGGPGGTGPGGNRGGRGGYGGMGRDGGRGGRGGSFVPRR